MVVTINEKIRFYKENDPYYYEVDNLPLIDLLENDRSLRDEINDIILNNQNWATEYFTAVTIQSAIGNSGDIDIQSDGVVTPNNVVAWGLGKNYLTLDDINPDDDGEDPYIPTKMEHLQDVKIFYDANGFIDPQEILVWDETIPQSDGVHFGSWRNRPVSEVSGIANTIYLDNRYFIIGQEKPELGNHTPTPDGQLLFNSRTQEEVGANVLDSHHFTEFAHIDNTTPLYTKRFTRMFQDMGIPENASKIYGKFAVMQIPDPLSVVGAEFHIEHAHSHTAPGSYGPVTDNPAILDSGNAWHAYESIAMDSTSANNTQWSATMREFTLHYGNAITHPDDPSKNVLTFATVQNNSTVQCQAFLYVYAYEI